MSTEGFREEIYCPSEGDYIESGCAVTADPEGYFIAVITDPNEGVAQITLPVAKLVHEALGRAIAFAESRRTPAGLPEQGGTTDPRVKCPKCGAECYESETDGDLRPGATTLADMTSGQVCPKCFAWSADEDWRPAALPEELLRRPDPKLAAFVWCDTQTAKHESGLPRYTLNEITDGSGRVLRCEVRGCESWEPGDFGVSVASGNSWHEVAQKLSALPEESA